MFLCASLNRVLGILAHLEIAEHLFYRTGINLLFKIGANLLFRIGANLLFSEKGETPDNELVDSLLVPTLLLLLNDYSIAPYRTL